MPEDSVERPAPALPWLIFVAGCLCPVLAYLIDRPGYWGLMGAGLVLIGFSACISAPWSRGSDDHMSRALLSLFAGGFYFLLCLYLLFKGGLHVD